VGTAAGNDLGAVALLREGTAGIVLDYAVG
jgi:hypothetical protein